MAVRIPTKKVVLVSFLVDLLDTLTNLLVAFFTGSAVIFAEMIQGAIDAFGSFLLIIGYRRANRPSDATHPFGYTREIFFWALLSSMVMLFLGSGLSIWRGYQQLIFPQDIQYKWLALLVLAISVLTNGYAWSLGYRKLCLPGVPFFRAFTESSRQLVKTAFLRDSLGTLSAIAGLVSLFLYDFFGLLVFDALGAISIGIIMAILAVVLISQARTLITGQTVPRPIRQKIVSSITKIPEVININRLAAVYTGSENILVDLDLDLRENLTTTQIEEVFDRIKETVVANVPETQSISIDLNSPALREEVKIEKILSPRH